MQLWKRLPMTTWRRPSRSRPRRCRPHLRS
jgi:hypothetical protein